MDSEEFLLRVCQYWVAAASARDASRIAYAPAREKVPEILLRLWKGRGKIGRGDVEGLRFDSELQALWIERGGFNEFIGPDIIRPDRIFYKKEQFYRNMLAFARSSIRTEWSKGKAPDLSPMAALLSRFQKDGKVDLSDNFTFAGTLVQQSFKGEGRTLVGFQDLSEDAAQAFGRSGFATILAQPAPSTRKWTPREDQSGHLAAGLAHKSAGAITSQHSPLRNRYLAPKSHAQVFANASDFAPVRPGPNLGVVHPKIAAADTTRSCQIIGVPGSGKTTAVHDLLERTPDQPILALAGNAGIRIARAIIEESYPGGATIVIENLQDHLTTALVETPLYQLKDIPNIRMVVTYDSPDAPDVRKHWPQLDYVQVVDLDDGEILEPLALAMAKRLSITASDGQLPWLARRVQEWDGAAKTLVAYLTPFANRALKLGSPLSTQSLPYWEGRAARVSGIERDVMRIVAGLRLLGATPLRNALVRQIARERNVPDIDATIHRLERERWVRTEEEHVFISDVCAEACGVGDDHRVLRTIIDACISTVSEMEPQEQRQLLAGIFAWQVAGSVREEPVLGDPRTTWELLRTQLASPYEGALYAADLGLVGDFDTAADLLLAYTKWRQEHIGHADTFVDELWMAFLSLAELTKERKPTLDLAKRALAIVGNPSVLLGRVFRLLVDRGALKRSAELLAWSVAQGMFTREEVDELLLNPPAEFEESLRKRFLQVHKRLWLELQR